MFNSQDYINGHEDAANLKLDQEAFKEALDSANRIRDFSLPSDYLTEIL